MQKEEKEFWKHWTVLNLKIALALGLIVFLLTSCATATDFCLVYEPLLPSRQDTEKTARHLNVYADMWDERCK